MPLYKVAVLVIGVVNIFFIISLANKIAVLIVGIIICVPVAVRVASNSFYQVVVLVIGIIAYILCSEFVRMSFFD